MIKYALIALACTAGLSTAALAQNDDIAVSAVNADLDLTRSRGKVALHSRLRKAVRAVCANDAACSYTAERESARQGSAAIAAAHSQLAMAKPTHLTVSGAH